MKGEEKRIEFKTKGKQTLEELGWTAHCSSLAHNHCKMPAELASEDPEQVEQQEKVAEELVK